MTPLEKIRDRVEILLAEHCLVSERGLSRCGMDCGEGYPCHARQWGEVALGLAVALYQFAEHGEDLSGRLCHIGLCKADECGRCMYVLEARAALAKAAEGR